MSALCILTCQNVSIDKASDISGKRHQYLVTMIISGGGGVELEVWSLMRRLTSHCISICIL